MKLVRPYATLQLLKLKKKATKKANRKECVMPRCANNSVLTGIHIPAIKSTSGMLCAKAPHKIALRPACLSKINSPIQAPRTICVTESIETFEYRQLSYSNVD